MNLYETNDYIKSKGIFLPNGQVFLKEPLFVYKKIMTYSSYYDDRVLRKRELLNSFTNISNISKWRGNVASVFRFCETETEWAIVNLIIPAHTIVNLCQSPEKKLRAERAFCWSIIRKDHNAYPHVLMGYSKFDVRTTYIAAFQNRFMEKDLPSVIKILSNLDNNSRKKSVLPYITDETSTFDRSNTECSRGIHFFLDSNDAVCY